MYQNNADENRFPYYFPVSQPYSQEYRWYPTYYPYTQIHPQPQIAWYYTPQETRDDFNNHEGQHFLTFVLIHGSWADVTFWDGIATELQKHGHTVYMPEYPGHGADNTKNVTHAMIVDSVVEYITNRNLKNIILVGHSFGGTVIQKVAEQISDRIKRLIFLDAFVLADGQSLVDQLPPPTQQGFQQLREASGNDTIMPPYSLFRETFVNLAGTDVAQAIYNKVKPEPATPLFEKLDLKKFYSLQTPRSYVYLTEDNVLPQGEGYGWHPHMSMRLGIFRLIKDRGDHISTANTDPARIAMRLYEAARD